ncbi:MAG: tetratricopeptide repeat protein [Magnetococcales bacterium]|nr:tetratricopeptide repeat protein [Magnetococcales bacterium]
MPPGPKQAADRLPALNEHGIRLAQGQNWQAAEAAFRQILDIAPTDADAHNNLGNLFLEQNRFAEAEQAYRQALRHDPGHAVACHNLGVVLNELDRPAEAEQAYRQALTLRPDALEVRLHLGILLASQRRHAEAMACLRAILAKDPEHADARWQLGLLALSLGHYAEGWHGYEARLHPRWSDRVAAPVDLPFPVWNGEDLHGRSLLVIGEQGIGDQIQFSRYLPLLKTAGGAGWITLVCRLPLAPLLTTLEGVDRVVGVGEAPWSAPVHDYWIHLLSLPDRLGTTPATIPAAIPYVRPLPDRMAAWHPLLAVAGLRVGLAWRGNPAHRNDRNRSLPGLRTLAPLWNVPGVTFFSLQMGEGAQEARQPPAAQPVIHLGDAIRDCADTAAIVGQLELIITVDTALAHLAGALGKACWVLLPAIDPDWRWMHDRDDALWYPVGMRLFRQVRPGDWSEVLQRVQRALEAEAANHAGMMHIMQQRLPEAESCLRHATLLWPQHADACSNLGIVLHARGAKKEAEALLRETARRHPGHVDVRYNLGLLLQGENRFQEAETCYREVLSLRPAHANAQWNLALLLLARGCFREGWALHEARFHPGHIGRKLFPPEASFPMWRGEPLAGKRLVLLPEQGMGDQIQFCRFAPLLKALGAAHITLVCRAPLAPLFVTLAGVDRILTGEQAQPLPDHDFWCFLLSIPLYLGIDHHNIPASLPYLGVLEERLTPWREKWHTTPAFRVGLVWKGDAGHADDVWRSLPGLAVLAPLWRVPGVTFVSLQKGAGEEEARHPPAGQPLWHAGEALRDFADTAALVAELDLVITIDSAVAHLAGALKKPCWVMLAAHPCDWRWQREREDSPWYPQVMRLFRQTRPGDWSDVVQRIYGELSSHLASIAR